MGDAVRDDYEAARRVALQLGRVEPLFLAQVPDPFDNRNQLVLRVGVREHAPAAGNFNSVYPHAALAGITEQLRALPAIVVVGGREPPHLFRG
jgi:hypothetical protein